MPSILIRCAQQSDASTAVPLIISSGPDAFSWVFNSGTISAADFLTYAFKSGKGQFGYHNHCVAEAQSEILGTIAYYTRTEFKLYNLQTIALILSFYGWRRCWGVFYRGLKVEATLPPPAQNALYLAHVAVAPQAQGKGIGSQLIQHALKSEKATTRAIASLDVAHSNPMAEKLYQRLGFVRVKNRRGATPDVPGHYLMEKVLP